MVPNIKNVLLTTYRKKNSFEFSNVSSLYFNKTKENNFNFLEIGMALEKFFNDHKILRKRLSSSIIKKFDYSLKGLNQLFNNSYLSNDSFSYFLNVLNRNNDSWISQKYGHDSLEILKFCNQCRKLNIHDNTSFNSFVFHILNLRIESNKIEYLKEFIWLFEVNNYRGIDIETFSKCLKKYWLNDQLYTYKEFEAIFTIGTKCKLMSTKCELFEELAPELKSIKKQINNPELIEKEIIYSNLFKLFNDSFFEYLNLSFGDTLVANWYLKITLLSIEQKMVKKLKLNSNKFEKCLFYAFNRLLKMYSEIHPKNKNQLSNWFNQYKTKISIFDKVFLFISKRCKKMKILLESLKEEKKV